MPWHKHEWVWKSRRYDIHGKAIDTYKCSKCPATEERKA
jgi:hypothetical protein